MNLPLITVIVPVYNSQEHIKTAAKSLAEQTYKNLEIILVNDGSTDRSLEICEELAENDGRFRVINRANGGVSAARNSGLEAANGEYIAFCDADDFACPTMIEHMYKIISENFCDIVHMLFHSQPEDKKDFSLEPVKGEVEIKSSDEALKWLLTRKGTRGTAIWTSMFRHSAIEGLRFPEGMAIAEDKMFFLLAFLKCGQVAFYSGKEYIYVERKSSAVHSDFSEKKLSSIILARRTQEIIEREKPEFADCAVINLYKVYLVNLRQIFNFPYAGEKGITYLNEIIAFLKQKTPSFIKPYLNKRELLELRLVKLGLPVYKIYIKTARLASKALK